MRGSVRQSMQGQAVTEFAILLGMVLLAVVSMGTYIKRGTQAVVKASADDLFRTDAGDANGEATQTMGIGQLVPQSWPEGVEVSQSASDVRSTMAQNYSPGLLTLTGDTEIHVVGTEWLPELSGNNSPITEGGAPTQPVTTP